MDIKIGNRAAPYLMYRYRTGTDGVRAYWAASKQCRRHLLEGTGISSNITRSGRKGVEREREEVASFQTGRIDAATVG
jgi:hypothetical protein